MIYELKDPSKAEKLFGGMADSMIRSCLQKVMGRVLATDPENPLSAMAVLADFVFFAGKPDREIAAAKPEGFFILVPPDRDWAKLIEDCFPNAEKFVRYAIRKDTRFCRERLEALAAGLPAGYTCRAIDAEIYDSCLGDPLFADCVRHFGSKERYARLGRGFAVLRNGKVVSACSSYTSYREGIEIEVDTAEEERRKGLACAVSAKLILSCLDDGLYPSWDAANLASVHLAEKLGYEYDRAYDCYGAG